MNVILAELHLVGRELKRFARTENERLAIRGEANLGEYARAMGQGAVEGAAGGAVGGALFGGVGAVPGAALGALGTAVGSLVDKGAHDAWYATRSKEDQASWQAGDLQEKLEKIVSLVQSRDPDMAKTLVQCGTDYKGLVDYAIQHKEVDVSQNAFNVAPEVQRASYLAQRAEMQARRTRSFADGLRTALAQAAATASPADAAKAMAGWASDTAQGVAKDNGAGMVAAHAAEAAAKKAIPQLAGAAASGAITHLGSIAGLGASFLAGMGINWLADQAERLGGELNEVKAHAEDARRIIREVNSLTDNQAQVREAGNQIYSHLQELIRSYEAAAQNVGAAKDQAQSAPAAPASPSSAPQPASSPNPPTAGAPAPPSGTTDYSQLPAAS